MAIKGRMTQEHWTEIENYYTDVISEIVLPDDPQTQDIKSILVQLDSIFCEARLDFSICKRNKEKIDRVFKLLHKQHYITAEGKTVTDKECFVVDFLRKNPVDGMNQDIYSLLDIAEHRYFFMEGVLEVLRSKQDRCVTASGILKIESSFVISNG